MAENCKNCRTKLTSNYCSNCGEPAKLKRINSHYISHEIQHLLHFEKGLFYSAKELLIRPGKSIREFINENRNKHMKPVAFLILTSIVYTVVAHFVHADKIVNEKEQLMFKDSVIGDMLHWVQAHLGYSNILEGIFIAFAVQLFFRKYRYNLFEIIVMLCFVSGQGMLLITFEALFLGIMGKGLFIIVLTIISFAYPTWAIGQFFDEKKMSSYLKAFTAYLIGYFMFYIAIIVVGLIIDVILRL